MLDDPASTPEVLGAAALALGQIFVGTCDGTVTEALITLIMTKTVDELKKPHGRFIALGLSLLYLGKQQECEVRHLRNHFDPHAGQIALATLATVPEPFGPAASMLLEVCAYAGPCGAVHMHS